MVLFSSTKLENALASESLDSWTKAKYMIFVVAMYGASNSFYWFTPSFGPKKSLSYYVASAASWFLSAVITYWGGKNCFRTNKMGDGKDFVERFSSLYVPLTFEFIPITLLFFLGTAGFVACLLPVDKQTKYQVVPYLALLVSPFLTWLFFVLLKRSFERLAELIRKQNAGS
jgi:hypothetical protein